jgi:hypothetical protein
MLNFKINSLKIYLSLIFILFTNLLSAQETINARKVNIIKSQLNHFEIDKALSNAQKLVDKNLGHNYYAELNVSILKQILARIQYSKIELGITSIKDNIDATKKVIAIGDSPSNKDSVAIDDEENLLADSAMLVFTTHTNELEEKVPLIVAPLSKKELRKLKRKKEFEESLMDENANGNLSNAEKNPIKAKQIITSKETTQDKEDANLESSRVSIADVIAPSEEGFKPTKTRRKKNQEKRLNNLMKFAAMDEKYYQHLLLMACRKATLFCTYADSASAYLCSYHYDTLNAKVLHKQEAADKLAEGDDAFAELDYENALINYNAAMTIDPKWYDAYLRMGEAYIKLHQDSLGQVYYITAKTINPNSPNADFKMAQYYYAKGKFNEALEHTLNAILIYPQSQYFEMIEHIALKVGKVFQNQWLPRQVYPLTTRNKFEDIVVDKESPWFWYQAAKQEFGSYANFDGTMRFNELSNEPYLETCAWLKMLDSSVVKTDFTFAKNMRKIGYLDCYILISLFHADIYPQFAHFVKNNPQKVKNYFIMLTSWDKKKFNEIKGVNASETQKPKRK